MKILVTGGSGFLGRTLVRKLLARGDIVRALMRTPQPELAREGCECLRGDIADAACVRGACAGCDAVFHTAAKTDLWGAYAGFVSTNINGTRNVIDGCRAAGVPFLVHTSTPSVVYSGKSIAGGDESLPLVEKCSCAYPLTKAAAERIVLAANENAALRTIALRPHLIWGVGDPHLVPRVLNLARSGKLRMIGAGKNRVDLTHIDNAVHAHLCALDVLCAGGEKADAAAGRAYFISDGAPVLLWQWINNLLRRLDMPPVTRRISTGRAFFAGTLTEILWKVIPLNNTAPPLTRFIAAQLAEDQWFDISAARRNLAYSPAVSTDAAFEALVHSISHQGKRA
ncbi:MAG: NAD-dependent epimerase/dehydratase family protein [Puniceicoccales bacterium]|jgi:nucleoside-diphosphate-sugar epimerase|nr:NAD-dependent epimerase/dehydratase family protein [Puniceicoccales bacterium]